MNLKIPVNGVKFEFKNKTPSHYYPAAWYVSNEHAFRGFISLLPSPASLIGRQTLLKGKPPDCTLTASHVSGWHSNLKQ